MSTTHLALLRGINVGGKNKLLMSDLREIFNEAGCRNVRTYIQSGNVIFEASPHVATALPGLITAQIAERFGLRVPVVLRTVAQLAEVMHHNPFLNAEGTAENMLHVLFLAAAPGAERVSSLDPDRSPPDTFVVHGEEIYLRLPAGAARTKLTNAYFDTKLATMSTGRNWQTVNKLLALMRE